MKNETKRLRLNRETVRELDEARLVDVNGGIPPWTPVVHTLPLNQCITVAVSGATC